MQVSTEGKIKGAEKKYLLDGHEEGTRDNPHELRYYSGT